ncbi:hypothetical protein ACFLSE_10030, partial [Bacteroidota bacterium]
MKILLTFILTFIVTSSYSQYWEYEINFEDTNEFFRLEIDTVSNSNNIWQIGSPDKTIFKSAFSEPNVIITDSINCYPTNDTSSFIIKHAVDVISGFVNVHTATIGGRYYVNSDTLTDYGILEISPDNGETWINLISDTTYLNKNCYTWWSPKPIFSGNSNSWVEFTVWVAGFGPEFNMQIEDTVLYKFSFISDNNESNKDGLMFDNLHFEDWYEGINSINIKQIISKAFPNPTNDWITIEFENPK